MTQSTNHPLSFRLCVVCLTRLNYAMFFTVSISEIILNCNHWVAGRQWIMNWREHYINFLRKYHRLIRTAASAFYKVYSRDLKRCASTFAAWRHICVCSGMYYFGNVVQNCLFSLPRCKKGPRLIYGKNSML